MQLKPGSGFKHVFEDTPIALYYALGVLFSHFEPFLEVPHSVSLTLKIFCRFRYFFLKSL